jgi:nitroreductase
MDVFTTIAMRRSTRMFKPEQIKDEDLSLILQAGQTAPVGHSDFAGVRLDNGPAEPGKTAGLGPALHHGQRQSQLSYVLQGAYLDLRGRQTQGRRSGRSM